jgi:hypothetical protein
MSFIRQARTMADKHENVCYYIDFVVSSILSGTFNYEKEKL